ncbi:MAG: ThuA domain-containing protein [Candidatus Ratteibacteria bacterium]|nr:ThuA domain-containing protein [Candidatus Ratteibacteria bacterium]
MGNNIKVTVWNEFVHEKKDKDVIKLYPKGIHSAIADYLKKRKELEVKTATLEENEHGLSEEVLKNTDTLIWWGHIAQNDVKDKIVERVHKHVLEGMGLIVLHSAKLSKIFKKLMGTTCASKWREADEREILWVVNPAHPIAEGIEEYIEIEKNETYGEHFDIPNPDELVFASWFEGGEIFRSGCCFYRGKGKIFYFSPGHETYPLYYNENVLRVIYNAVHWTAKKESPTITRGNVKSLEK